jgi:hypothetical protein
MEDATAEAERILSNATESATAIRAEADQYRSEANAAAVPSPIEPEPTVDEPVTTDDAEEASVDDQGSVAAREFFAERMAAASVTEDESAPVEEKPQRSRYERQSAKLPRIGDDAANVVKSLESFRKSLRGS